MSIIHTYVVSTTKVLEAAVRNVPDRKPFHKQLRSNLLRNMRAEDLNNARFKTCLGNIESKILKGCVKFNLKFLIQTCDSLQMLF